MNKILYVNFCIVFLNLYLCINPNDNFEATNTNNKKVENQEPERFNLQWLSYLDPLNLFGYRDKKTESETKTATDTSTNSGTDTGAETHAKDGAGGSTNGQQNGNTPQQSSPTEPQKEVVDPNVTPQPDPKLVQEPPATKVQPETVTPLSQEQLQTEEEKRKKEGELREGDREPTAERGEGGEASPIPPNKPLDTEDGINGKGKQQEVAPSGENSPTSNPADQSPEKKKGGETNEIEGGRTNGNENGDGTKKAEDEDADEDIGEDDEDEDEDDENDESGEDGEDVNKQEHQESQEEEGEGKQNKIEEQQRPLLTSKDMYTMVGQEYNSHYEEKKEAEDGFKKITSSFEEKEANVLTDYAKDFIEDMRIN